jgi:hypothetical protein
MGEGGSGCCRLFLFCGSKTWLGGCEDAGVKPALQVRRLKPVLLRVRIME